MKHFSTEEWIDFANQAVPARSQTAMQKHLRVCKRCKETLSMWQKVGKMSAVEGSYQPSEQAVRLAKAAFAESRLARTPKKSRGLVELLFDSFMQPAFAGARSIVIGTRQMLYRAEPYQIDIQIEQKPGVNRLVVTGQLLDLSHPGITTMGHDVLITLSNRRGNSVVAPTNQFGEFSGEIENSGDLELSIPSRGEEPIVISLRNALDQFSGGKA